MSDVQFTEENTTYRTRPVAKTSGLTTMLIRRGIAKDAHQANIIMIVIALGAIAISGWLLISQGGEPDFTPEQERVMEQMLGGRAAPNP